MRYEIGQNGSVKARRKYDEDIKREVYNLHNLGAFQNSKVLDDWLLQELTGAESWQRHLPMSMTPSPAGSDTITIAQPLMLDSIEE